MKKIVIINGPNLNCLDKERKVYGKDSLDHLKIIV